MSFVPKSVFKALDHLETSLNAIEENPAKEADPVVRDVSLAVTITGLIVLYKRLKGEDSEEALAEFEKCNRAFDRLSKSNPTASSSSTLDKVESKPAEQKSAKKHKKKH